MSKAREGAARPGTGEARFAAYLDEITSELGHASRAASARAYCTGLLLPGERKSIEPMAAQIEPTRVQARHQSLHHMVAKAEWDDAAVLAAVRRQVLPAIERHGRLRYWILDDTGLPKKGRHSVATGVAYPRNDLPGSSLGGSCRDEGGPGRRSLVRLACSRGTCSRTSRRGG